VSLRKRSLRPSVNPKERISLGNQPSIRKIIPLTAAYKGEETVKL